MDMNVDFSRYYDYYTAQAQGNGVVVSYRFNRGQRGEGLGSLLSGVFRSVLPYISNGAKTLGSEILEAGLGLFRDHLKGKNIKDSIDTRLKEASNNLSEKASSKLKSMMGLGIKRNNTKTRHQSNKNPHSAPIKNRKPLKSPGKNKLKKSRSKSRKIKKKPKNSNIYNDIFAR
jgi:hypothetical protein